MSSQTRTTRRYIREADKYDDDGNRFCTDCEYYLPLEKFRITGEKISSACGKCKDLRELYRINRRDFDKLMVDQQGACAICREPKDSSELHVDHDHACCPGRKCCGDCIRGLLCQGCNVGIGHLGESVERMRRAALYLGRHQ